MILICTEDGARNTRWHEAASNASESIIETSRISRLETELTRHPDSIVLLDLALPELHDGDGIESLMAHHHDARLIVLSRDSSDRECRQLLRLGIRGYLSAQAAASRVRLALERVVCGEIWAPRRLLTILIDEYRRHIELSDDEMVTSPEGLTVRQHEVIGLVAQGLHNKQIARSLDISERTVKAHLSAIFKRTGTSNRTELALRFRNIQ